MLEESDKLKNVIIVNDHSYINGGQAKIAIDTAIGLKTAGKNVIFFSACGPADAALNQYGVESICLNQKDIADNQKKYQAATRGIWNNEAAHQLLELTEKYSERDTVIHCHGFAKALSASIGPIITNGRIPHIYTMHEYFLACPNGGFYDFQSNEICTKRALGISCLMKNCDSRHASHKAWRVMRQGVIQSIGGLPKNLKDVIYISKTQKRVMKPYLSSKTKLHYVPNPITLPNSMKIDAQDNDIFLFIGRLNPEKGGALFAKAAKLAGVKAVFVGDGTDREKIQKINPAAVITGWVQPEDVSKWLEKARCLVFPSLWYETFGLVAYEAILKNVPVIAGRWNAASEAIKHNENGILVESKDPQEWADAFKKLDGLPNIKTTQTPAKDLSLTEYTNSILKVFQLCRKNQFT